ncbi:MAG: glutamate-1-semialdehyde 2,1-aminomutase [Gammaproteobacteria bacterium]|nr:glutamate-1-semialdehyde 2,1-aminomutase [Gammaproteobacteria bacterium]
MFSRSEFLFEEAKKILVGGVNSPVRAFKGVGGTPIFFKRAHGAECVDEDGRTYIDYVGAWGPMVLGHTHPRVVEAIREACAEGLAYGAPSVHETQLAQKIRELLPSIERLRFVNSGTEATMTAIRLARAITKRDRLIKFTGCYHGHSDSLLVSAGSGVLTCGIPSSPGVPSSLAEMTQSFEFNDLAQVKEAFRQRGNEIAAIIVEPIAGNMGCIPATEEFLSLLRVLCDQYGSLLIFDEVMTGFRVGLHGAEALYNVHPDLITLGKIIGGGLPIGALGGAAKLMQELAPHGLVYQAGTQSGNPVVMAAGLATLAEIVKPGFYEALQKSTTDLANALSESAKRWGIPLVIHHVPGMFSLFFTQRAAVQNYQDVKDVDKEIYRKFFHGLLKKGVYFPPSPFESAFVSAAHDDKILNKTIRAVCEVFKEI